MAKRTIEQAWTKPEFQVFCETGMAHGAMQIAILEYKGRTAWKTRRTAEKRAREFTERHGLVAYVSEC